MLPVVFTVAAVASTALAGREPPCLGPPDRLYVPSADAFVAPAPRSLRGGNTGASQFVVAGTDGVRALVAFDDVTGGNVAKLRVPTETVLGRLPEDGAVLVAYPLRRFTEGDGVFRRDRGDGAGVTFACFESTDIADPDAECAIEWSEDAFENPSARARVTGDAKYVELDVSGDVEDGISAWALAIYEDDAAEDVFGIVAPSREAEDREPICLTVSFGCGPAEIPELTTTKVAEASSAITIVNNGVDRNKLFVGEQGGRVRILDTTTWEYFDEDFLVLDTDTISTGGEFGLISLAFHPRFARNGQFFIYYTNTDTDVVIARMSVTDNADVADPDSLEVLLEVPQPFGNNNGGALRFDEDGMLYAAFGDGGSINGPMCSSQDDDSLLGKMIRIDVDNGDPYAIPSDNPNPDSIIWAKGLRNPYRWDFDERGGIWLPDVNQDGPEEINYVRRATRTAYNFGWNSFEGSVCVAGFGEECAQDVDCEDVDGYVWPVHEYDHNIRCAVTGGWVYRGDDIPEARGAYFFGDFCSGEVMYIRHNKGAYETEVKFTVGIGFGNLRTFGQDATGEIYVVSGADILKMVPAEA